MSRAPSQKELEAELVALRSQLRTAEQAAERSKESEEKYRTLIENTKDTLYAATPDGQLTYLGQQFARYGFDLEQVMREGVFATIVPEDHERVLADIQRTMETGAEFPTEFRVRT